MEDDELVVAYVGDAVDDGRMRVDDVSPSLLALSSLMRQVQRHIDAGGPDVELSVGAREHGSHEVFLYVAGTFATLFANDPATAAANLRSLIQSVADLLRWVKRVGGRSIERLGRDGEYEEVRIDNREVVREKTTIIELGNLFSVRRDLREVTRPLSRDGYGLVEYRYANDQVVTLEPTDWPAFADVPIESRVEEVEYYADLLVQQVAFDPELKWRFTEGQSRFPAAVEDVTFLRRVAENQESFQAGDTLAARIRLRREKRDDGTISATRSIVEVLDHRPGTSQDQTSLPIGDNESQSD